MYGYNGLGLKGTVLFAVTGGLLAGTFYLGMKILKWNDLIGVIFIILGCLTSLALGFAAAAWVGNKLYEANLDDDDDFF